ncbi:MAG TPA: site-specific integrase [Edaphobacter sp.]|nr:site-specific integrase [Edaphobacter sp.]
MSVYRQKGKQTFIMDFWFQGQRVRESTGASTKNLALKVERNRKTGLEEGKAGVQKQKKMPFFASAADDFLDKRWKSVPGGKEQKDGKGATVLIDQGNIAHLKPHFGKTLLCDISPSDISSYQHKRLKEGAAPKTVNLELGTFRSILTPSGHWTRLLPEVDMLEVHNDVGIALTGEQQVALEKACSQSLSRMLYPLMILLVETGVRVGAICNLKWETVDFVGGGLRIGKDKTKAGRRTVPVTRRAMAVLEMWAENFPKRKPDHFVFPQEMYRLKKGQAEMELVSADPTKHVGSVKRSWATALHHAGWILAGSPSEEEMVEVGTEYPPLKCRLHDLRHTAITHLIQTKTPIPIIAQLVGWSPSQMILMAARYGHYEMDILREAIETASDHSRTRRMKPKTARGGDFGGDPKAKVRERAGYA